MRSGRIVPLTLGLLAASLGLTDAWAQPAMIQARPAVVVGNKWFLRNTLTTGVADFAFKYGPNTNPGYPLMGDWNGDGLKTPGLVYKDNKWWFLRNSNSNGISDVFVRYGFSFGVPIAGDWDGDGIDTIGMVHVKTVPGQLIDSCDGFRSTWYLRNSNTDGPADETFDFGCPGTPLVGDWDGDGDDTPGVRQAGTHFWALNNDLDSTFDEGTDVALFYGTRHDFPLVGDWDGDGDDTPGVRQWNVWAFRNSNTSGVADFSFAYGSGTHTPLVWGQAP